MGFWTSVAAAGASASSKLMAGAARRSEFEAAAEVNRINAAGLRRDAEATDRATRFSQVRAAQAGERRVGAIRARAGASGALVSQGAPMHALIAQLMDNELEVALIGQRGRAKAAKLRRGAAGQLTAAEFNEVRGDNAMLAGISSASAGLLRNVSTMYAQDMFPASPAKSSSPSGPQSYGDDMGVGDSPFAPRKKPMTVSKVD